MILLGQIWSKWLEEVTVLLPSRLLDSRLFPRFFLVQDMQSFRVYFEFHSPGQSV